MRECCVLHYKEDLLKIIEEEKLETEEAGIRNPCPWIEGYYTAIEWMEKTIKKGEEEEE